MTAVTGQQTRRPVGVVLAGVMLAMLTSCAPSQPGDWTGQRWPTPPTSLAGQPAARWTVTVLDELVHDQQAFTQGLERLANGSVIESLGLRGHSEIRIVEPDSGQVIRSAPLPAHQFGEGLTVHQQTAIQLTWQAGVAHRWSLPELSPLPSWTFDGEGWGLCAAAGGFVMSDGTSTLTLRSFDDFAVQSTLTVTLDGEPVDQLNELECVDGMVMANIWRRNKLLVIAPTGQVVAVIDVGDLAKEVAVGQPGSDVVNGIAAEPNGTFLITGKRWPTMFRVGLTTETG